MTKSQAGQTSEKNLAPQPGMVPIYLGLTWLCPGLGHVLMGDVRRGLILGITIWSLFLSGLLIGGVGVVDSKLNRAWFLGQLSNGPAVILSVVREKTMMANPNAKVGSDGYLGTPDVPNDYEPSFGRPNEIGILYTALAGLLNLFIFYDVFDRGTYGQRDPQVISEEASA
ncbi:MAG: DUF6677 family protein [Phycisphaeraceae bacterium JB051]